MGWSLRGIALALVFAMAVLAFRLGVDVSQRPGMPDAGWLTQLYYAAGLFVLGGLGLGTPSQGPVEYRWLLWSAYFLAPLITTSAVVEGTLRLLGSRVFDRVGLNNHLLVVGCGRLGSTFVRAVRRVDPNGVIVVVDKNVQQPALLQLQRHHRVRLFPGEARLEGAFTSLSVARSRGVALLTEDDLLNVNAAFQLAAEHPELPIVAHVSNLSLQRVALEMCREMTSPRPVVFNAHRAIAEHLYSHHLKPYFDSTPDKDSVVLAGFGRFGQTILELLRSQASADLHRLLLVDRSASIAYRAYCAQVEDPLEPAPATLDGDLGDPECWEQIYKKLGHVPESPVVLVGSDDDNVNLQGAVTARRLWPEARIFVRFQRHSVFAERVAERHGFTILAIEATLMIALVDAQRTWFENERQSRATEVKLRPTVTA